MLKHIHIAGVAGLLLLTGAGRAEQPGGSAPPAAKPASRQAAARILVDSIHAHNALRPAGELEACNYHYVYGFRRAFDWLGRCGLEYDEVTTGRLDAARLRRYRLVFINLVSADLPPFMTGEIAALRDYVWHGGSLLVITDHSNCYYHAYKLAPLLEQLGIESPVETACDRPPHTLGPGNGWIAITRFAPHPVTAGLRCIAFQSGGVVDARYAVASTSPASWGDRWQVNPYGEGNAPGFYGNWEQDPGERSGPLGVVLARKFGRGRVVIVGDQNIFGDPFLNYADNYRLFLNTIAWLTGQPAIADYRAYEQSRSPRLLLYEDYTRAAFGNSSAAGYNNVFAAIGRALPAFARDELTAPCDLMVFAHDNYPLAPDALEAVTRHLRAGRSVVFLNPGAPDPAGSGAGQEAQAPGNATGSKPAEAGAPTTAPGSVQGETNVTARLMRRLGAAETVSTHPSRVYRWPGTGRMILLSGGDIFLNRAFPTPETRLNTAEQLCTSNLVQELRAATR